MQFLSIQTWVTIIFLIFFYGKNVLHYEVTDKTIRFFFRIFHSFWLMLWCKHFIDTWKICWKNVHNYFHKFTHKTLVIYKNSFNQNLRFCFCKYLMPVYRINFHNVRNLNDSVKFGDEKILHKQTIFLVCFIFSLYAALLVRIFSSLL